MYVCPNCRYMHMATGVHTVCIYICADITYAVYLHLIFCTKFVHVRLLSITQLKFLFNCKRYLNSSELLQLLKFVSLLIYFMGNFRCYKSLLYGIHMYVRTVCTYHNYMSASHKSIHTHLLLESIYILTYV